MDNKNLNTKKFDRVVLQILDSHVIDNIKFARRFLKVLEIHVRPILVAQKEHTFRKYGTFDAFKTLWKRSTNT